MAENGADELEMANGKTYQINEQAQKYMNDLLSERIRMENNFPLAVKLIDDGNYKSNLF